MRQKAVATATARAMNELYEELETLEGERKIYRIANARDKMTNWLDNMMWAEPQYIVLYVGRRDFTASHLK